MTQVKGDYRREVRDSVLIEWDGSWWTIRDPRDRKVLGSTVIYAALAEMLLPYLNPEELERRAAARARADARGRKPHREDA